MYARPGYAKPLGKAGAAPPPDPEPSVVYYAEPVMSTSGELTTVTSGDIVMTLVTYSDPFNLGGTEQVAAL